MRPIPDRLLHGPFTRASAHDLKVSDRMLEGRLFDRVLPRVWRHRDHVMTDEDWVTAAKLALPAGAHLTGVTRIQQLGLDYGPRLPVRFVVEGDLHLAYHEIFLHRTVRLPPTDDVGVTPTAAFIAYCSRARVIDAIKVGDWLLHHGHTTVERIRDLALAELWRPGAHEALWALDHLDGRARSLPESETRAVLVFAGLPAPEVNVAVDVGEDVGVIGDLLYRPYRVLVEYEGRQHQEDRDQYNSDLARYALLRDAAADYGYVQVTHEKLRHAKTLVGEVYRALLRRGYDGPAPTFEGVWPLLFLPLSAAVGPRDHPVAPTGR
ncbi:hypothetical protein [Nocardioides sp. W7]|uniref:hypothetical protein n=1 Tax=Nocardioides sp. W7 TaxID=2931390 RepID=UPI001FCFC011|nr:hypothetical protein [Nocardioides sp. W7]